MRTWTGAWRRRRCLSEIGDGLVDLHGQHVHQSLCVRPRNGTPSTGSPGATSRRSPRRVEELTAIDARLAELGGDPRALARTVGLLRFQLDEIAAAAITAGDEEAHLAAEESLLAQVGSLRIAMAEAREALVGSDASLAQSGPGVTDLLGAALARLGAHPALADLAGPLRSAQADVEDVARELRLRDERLEEDPDRLEAVRRRLQLLADLRRKYGATLAEVIEFARASQAQLAELESAEETRAGLQARRLTAVALLEEAEARLGACRRQAAPKLAAAVEAHLHELALSGSRLEVRIGDDRAGSEVEFLLGANPGEPSLPLAKVASGGELARAMLATRLVLSAAPPTLVFDEVDAGVGGEAALAVGRALSAIGRDHQVLVVTHLAEVAAFADRQVLVSKSESQGRTVARARPVTGEDRIVELSRMLSGHPDSPAARRHAKELLAMAARSGTVPGSSGNVE